jgi:hypothetical protein
MTKRIAMGALAVLFTAGMSLATTTKFKDFEVWSTESSDVDGSAMMKYVNSNAGTHVTIVVHSLTPGQTYDIIVGSDNGGLELSGTANSGGNLSINGDTPDGIDITGPNSFLVLAVGSDVRVVSLGQ